MIDTTLVRFADTLQATIPTCSKCKPSATCLDSLLNMGWPSAFVLIALFALIMGIIVILSNNKAQTREFEKRINELEEEKKKLCKEIEGMDKTIETLNEKIDSANKVVKTQDDYIKIKKAMKELIEETKNYVTSNIGRYMSDEQVKACQNLSKKCLDLVEKYGTI